MSHFQGPATILLIMSKTSWLEDISNVSEVQSKDLWMNLEEMKNWVQDVIKPVLNVDYSCSNQVFLPQNNRGLFKWLQNVDILWFSW